MRGLSKPAFMILFVTCAAGMTVPSAAQDYPVKPVRIVTGDPGTMMDIVSRQLAQRLGALWGRSVVIENRGGFGNASVAVGQASPNGYTLLVADSGALSIRPYLFRSLPYDPDRDFAPIVLLASGPKCSKRVQAKHAVVCAVSGQELLRQIKIILLFPKIIRGCDFPPQAFVHLRLIRKNHHNKTRTAFLSSTTDRV